MITSKPVEAERTPSAASVKKQIGILPGTQIERAFVLLLRIVAWLLIGLSILGTFYGARGAAIPLTTPLAVVSDIVAMPIIAAMALFGQGLLAVVQWGARQLARQDRRWWAVYLVSLALSAWWNWTAYGTPLIDLNVPWLVAIGIILGGDIFPEVTLVK